MPFVNMMESIAEEIFREFMIGYPLKCSCQKCKEDIIALTLNRVPPKYVSSHIGEVHIKTRYLNNQLRMDIMREIARSTLIVQMNPNHELAEATATYSK